MEEGIEKIKVVSEKISPVQLLLLSLVVVVVSPLPRVHIQPRPSQGGATATPRKLFLRLAPAQASKSGKSTHTTRKWKKVPDSYSSSD